MLCFQFYVSFFLHELAQTVFPFAQNEHVNLITACKQKKSKPNDPVGLSNQTPDSRRILKSIENLHTLVSCSFVNGFSDN